MRFCERDDFNGQPQLRNQIRSRTSVSHSNPQVYKLALRTLVSRRVFGFLTVQGGNLFARKMQMSVQG